MNGRQTFSSFNSICAGKAAETSLAAFAPTSNACKVVSPSLECSVISFGGAPLSCLEARCVPGAFESYTCTCCCFEPSHTNNMSHMHSSIFGEINLPILMCKKSVSLPGCTWPEETRGGSRGTISCVALCIALSHKAEGKPSAMGRPEQGWHEAGAQTGSLSGHRPPWHHAQPCPGVHQQRGPPKFPLPCNPGLCIEYGALATYSADSHVLCTVYDCAGN